MIPLHVFTRVLRFLRQGNLTTAEMATLTALQENAAKRAQCTSQLEKVCGRARNRGFASLGKIYFFSNLRNSNFQIQLQLPNSISIFLP